MEGGVMTAATEGYADATAAKAVAIGEANVEKAVNRLIRWVFTLQLSTLALGITIGAALFGD